MSNTEKVEHANQKERREDFPIETFGHLDCKIGIIRRISMERAAAHSDATQPNGDTYHVEEEDIDAGINSLLDDDQRYELLGIAPPSQQQESIDS